MPKKKKAAKKMVKAKTKAKARPKVKVKLKAKAVAKGKSGAKAVHTPIMQYRPSREVKPPKGPKLTKSPFSKSELDLFKKILTELRRKISGDIQQIEGETLNTSSKDSSGDLSGYSFHMADVATDSFDRELNIGLASNEQSLLNDVDDAMKKIDEGIYGICEKYGVAIPKKRLMVAPYVRYCLQAQEEEEKEPRRS
jgi:RNA polymerase-binding transcription factor DksA